MAVLCVFFQSCSFMLFAHNPWLRWHVPTQTFADKPLEEHLPHYYKTLLYETFALFEGVSLRYEAITQKGSALIS